MRRTVPIIALLALIVLIGGAAPTTAPRDHAPERVGVWDRLASEFDEVGNQFVNALDGLPLSFSEHIMITVIALMAGLVIMTPVAIFAARRRWLSVPLLAGASVIQTIPSIAMLALIYLIFSTINQAMQDPATGAGGIANSSLWAALIALYFYSILPILRNTVTGIQGVDPAMTEAARGVGMTGRQVLTKVELPLALPVIIAGIRTSTVWVVGIATLAQPVGQNCLGDQIFTGLQINNRGMVLLGCVAAALLALVLDGLTAMLQSGAEQRKKGRMWLAVILLGLVVVAGLTPAALAKYRGYRARQDAEAAARARGEELIVRDVLVGAKTFDEQFILASLIRHRLGGRAQFLADKRQGLGSVIAFQQLQSNDIQVYVDYTGTIWAVHMKRDEVADPDTVYREVKAWLKQEHGIECVGRLGFENAYALAMRRDRAEQLGIETIADLRKHQSTLTVGGDYEFFGRPEWQNIVKTYDLELPKRNQKKYQSTLMYQAVRGGDVDVISAFSSDGRIVAYDLKVLEDPRNALPPYDAIILVSRQAADWPRFVETLKPLVGSITDDMMRQANYMVDRDKDKKTPEQAAGWLSEQISAGAQ
jgi:osmoprotectant transport system permease protein